MSDGLFDIPEEKRWVHACTGLDCPTCASERNSEAMQGALNMANDWVDLANKWFTALPVGYSFTSEDLTDAVGLPAGESGMNRNNAVGAFVRSLSSRNYVKRIDVRSSRKKSSNGAALIVWSKV